MTAINQCLQRISDPAGTRLLKGALGVLSIILILYLAWLLCGAGCGLFGLTGGQV